MNIAFSFFSKEECLIGLQVCKYNVCNSKDENNRLILKTYYDVSVGLLFCLLTIKIFTGEAVSVK